ncbi:MULTISPECIES: hypothetical protein [Bacillus cereus group]|uniref:hypothetical protein n=1 Tax=Bacillus cereus group TaxID=86661 RepID=UPI000A3CF98D|nr:hypothetical protein [Bacillus cereus]OTW67349.1 hypothetical protein BK701_07030 [Bacillus thuringiensis serovar amagiensis]OTY65561.1 hypothetical protein BK747_16180 [Bacillus thuringiensis serovar azorensis]OUA88365.1 hypothetical protein BK706_17280 [Bacillus thuringiensis serovar leesis]
MAGFVSLKLKYTSKIIKKRETIVILKQKLLKKSKNKIILNRIVLYWVRISNYGREFAVSKV